MIALDRLIACALDELDAGAEVEEHVVSCSACAARYEALVRLGPAIGELVRSGGATLVASATLVDQLAAAKLVSRRYVIAPGAMVACSVGAEDIYALTTLEADLRGVTRLDIVSGPARFDDVPFDAAAGHVYLLARSDVIRHYPSMRLPFRLLAIEPDGSERALGDYTLDHHAA